MTRTIFKYMFPAWFFMLTSLTPLLAGVTPIEVLNRAIEKDPRNAILYLERGILRADLHDHTSAFTDCCKAEERGLKSYLLYYKCGESAYWLNGIMQ